MTITADRLLRGIKRRISYESTGVLLDDDDLLELADDMIRARIVPLLISVRGDFFVRSVDETLVADQAAYNLPDRAAGLTLRDLKLRWSDGTATDLNLIPIEEEHLHRQASSSEPFGFYFRNDELVLIPTPDSATADDAVLEIWHEQRPSRLVLLEDCAGVSSVAADVVSTDGVPAALAADVEVDFVRGKGGCRLLAMEKAIATVASNDITFATDDVPDGLAAGDYIAAAGTSPVLQFPDECQPFLETLVCMRATGALSDYEAKQELQGDLKAEEDALKLLLEPRIRGAAKKIVNRSGLLRGRLNRTWRNPT